jgi:hypothetical protein
MPMITKKIHFIWVGGILLEADFYNIRQLTVLASQSGFDVFLWVDRAQNYYNREALESILMPDNFKLCQLNELLHSMASDPFYQTDDRLKKFELFYARETVGAKNLAAVSDFFRYEILRKTGGYYFDTNTEFNIESDSILMPDDAAEGVLISASCSRYETIFNNDILAAVPGHPILEETLSQLLANYQYLDQNTEYNYDRDFRAAQSPSPHSFQSTATLPTLMDQKRREDGCFAPNYFDNRLGLTLISSGPGLLLKTAGLEELRLGSLALFQSRLFQYNQERFFRFANIAVKGFCRGTWHDDSQPKRSYFFDDINLRASMPFFNSMQSVESSVESIPSHKNIR